MFKKLYRRIKVLYQNLKRADYLFYKGVNYSCPVCNTGFNRLKPYKGEYYIKGKRIDHATQNYFCPKCGSGIRHRLVMGFLKEKPELIQNITSLLHFAPEASISKYLESLKKINYIKADIDPGKLPDTIKLDITKIDMDDQHVDAIICIHVLEHISNDLQAIQELYRVLKNGGWLLLALPVYGEKTYEIDGLTADERKKQYGIDDHMRLNGLDLKVKLEKAGFNVNIVSTNDLKGNYFDLTQKTPHSESDKYLFFCTR